jgi:hypothetical protein
MRTRGHIARAALVAAAGLVTGTVLGTWVQPAGAGEPPSVIQVTTTDDVVTHDVPRSLREAFTLANANPDHNTIQLAFDEVYELDVCGATEDGNASGDLDLHGGSALTIDGNISTIRQTCAGERVLDVAQDLELVAVVVEGGQVVGNGGGVWVGDQLDLDGSVVQHSTATGDGGGAWVGSGAHLVESTVAGNDAVGAGGGIWADRGGSVERSAVVGNQADRGGGLATGPAAGADVVWDLESSTVAGNRAETFAGGVWSALGQLEVETTTVADNTSVHPGGAANVDVALLESEGDSVIADPHGSPTSCSVSTTLSDGGNVDDGASCGFTGALDRSAVDVDVRAPFLVGGTTPVAHPYEGSALIDTGICGASPLEDQRGVDRPVGGACDVGAFEVEPCDEAFADVGADHPFCWEISWMAAARISDGYGDGTYRPAPAVSRQAMSAFLLRLANERPTRPSTPTFADVPTDHPFFLAIEWMAARGISSGYADGTYRPDAPVSRQAMSAFLQRLARAQDVVPAQPSFAEVGPNHPFAGAIEWMAGTEVSTGYPDGTYRPLEPVSRQAMSAFLYRLADGLVVQGLALPI